MKTINLTLRMTGLLLCGIFVLSACSKDNDGGKGNAEPKAEKGYLTGKATDTQGNPIAGAKLTLENTVLYSSYLYSNTDEDGIYKVKLHTGTWWLTATFKKEYNGKTYTLPLSPDHVERFTEDGGVCNFTWKLEGADPDNPHYFYGGQVNVSRDIDFYEDEEDIELTFTPSGPLIDGSEGKTLVLRYGEHYWKDYYYIKDIPVGRYIVTAVLKGDQGDVPLKIQNWHTKSDFISELQLDFIPDDTFRPTPEASIVIGY